MSFLKMYISLAILSILEVAAACFCPILMHYAILMLMAVPVRCY